MVVAFARLVDRARHVQHLGMTADAADHVHVDARARDAARDQRRRRARVRCIDVERCGNEEEEAAAALDDHDLAAAGAEHVETHAPQFGVLLRRDALVEALAFDRNGDVAGGSVMPRACASSRASTGSS